MSSGFVLVWLTWLSSCLPLPADYCLVYCIFHGLLLASVLIFDYMPWLQYECLRNCYSRPLALVGKRCCASLICNSLSYCCISAGLLSSSYMFWKQTLWQCCNWTWTSSLIPAIVCLYLSTWLVKWSCIQPVIVFVRTDQQTALFVPFSLYFTLFLSLPVISILCHLRWCILIHVEQGFCSLGRVKLETLLTFCSATQRCCHTQVCSVHVITSDLI